jgi:enoyl-CoA hydratase/carnithine racemase
MEYRSILYKKEGGKATITLNRPRALNALNREIIEELFFAQKRRRGIRRSEF